MANCKSKVTREEECCTALTLGILDTVIILFYSNNDTTSLSILFVSVLLFPLSFSLLLTLQGYIENDWPTY